MILEMRDICKDYQMGKASTLHVLKHVNLRVDEGDYIAIMGPSGSGKSTLMNIIGCLDVPTSGSYNLEGNEIGKCSDNQLAELRNKYIEALKIVGLEDRMSHHPDQLSGGQNQRVAIARAIVGNPKLLLADEPTGALDSTSGKQVMELFKELHANGATIIMITHDANIAAHAETEYRIFDGILTPGNEAT